MDASGSQLLQHGGPTWIVVVAFVVAFALAFGIGANDVANSFATSVGSGTLTLFQACLFATFAEFSGAVLLGGQVSSTIQNGIVQSELYADEPTLLMLGMTTALMATAIWLLLATYMKLPVSATHAIVSAIIGFTLVAKGSDGVNWWELGRIIMSWVVSPVLAGAIAVLVYYIINSTVLMRAHSFERGLKGLPFIYGVTIAVSVFPVVQQLMNAVGDAYPYLSSEICSDIGVCLATWLSTVVAFAVGIVVGLLTGLLVRWIIVPRTRTAVLAQDLMLNEDLVELLPVSYMPSPSKDDLSMVDSQLVNLTAHAAGDDLSRVDATKSGAAATAAAPATPAMQPDVARIIAALPAEHIAEDDPAFTADADDDHLLTHDGHAKASRSCGLCGCKCRKWTKHHNVNSDTEQQQTERLFKSLQVITAVFGSFVHGSNDVSNAIGPLAAVFFIWQTDSVLDNASTPLWILAYGGVGIVLGLAIWGSRVIQTLGTDLTALTPSRGFCIELGSAMTVLLASRVGIPVSTTHCKVGAVVAVGYASNDGAVSWRLFGGIFLCWAATIPFAGLISAGLFAALRTAL